MTFIDLLSIFPQIFLLTMVVLILMMDCFYKKSDVVAYNYKLALIALFGSAILIIPTFGWFAIAQQPTPSIVRYWDGQVQRFAYIDLLMIASLIITGLGLIYSKAVLKVNNLYKSEFFVLILLSVLGILVLCTAASLLGIYLGLELMSLAMYALVAFDRKNGKAVEAAMKYFVMGAMASGLLLFGMALLYGATHSLSLLEIMRKLFEFSKLNTASQIMLTISMILMLAGVAFKLGVVPFHSWVPDVYEGAPTPVVTFVSAAPKLATVAMLIALFTVSSNAFKIHWQPVMQMMAFLSFAVGNLVALRQINIKRMLAYSAISHAGFVFLGTASGGIFGGASAIFYIVTYAFTCIAAFGLLMLMQKDEYEIKEIIQLKGLLKTHPWFAVMFVIVMLSMAGIPLTVGFNAKLEVLKAAIGSNLILSSVAALVFSVIGAFYYLRIVKIICFDEADKPLLLPEINKIDCYVISVNAVLIIVLGVLPNYLMSLCEIILRAN